MTQHKKDIEKARGPRKALYVSEPRTFEGCCKPYPDVNYANKIGGYPTVHMHHIGPSCAGYRARVEYWTWMKGPRRAQEG